MRVLLVYANPIRDILPAPPVGLGYVASATRRAGHDVRFLDLMPKGDTPSKLREAVREFRPQVVGFSVRNIENLVHQRVERHLVALAGLIAVVRERSEAVVVLGGPAISILGPTALAHLDADFAVVGEGETTFPKLLAVLATGAEPQRYGKIAGLCYRDGDRIVATEPVRLSTFHASGLAEWIDWLAYERLGSTWPIQTKRGCQMRCGYCVYPFIEGTGCRLRPSSEVVDEIAEVAATVGPRAFEFVDSTFNVPAHHAIAICREIIDRRLRVQLTAMGVNPLNTSEELFALMKEAGFRSLMITPEAANDTMLRNLCKGFTRDHVVRTARWVRAADLTASWFFMLGGPGETPETVEETVAFAEEHLSWKRFLTIFFTGIRILPGTELAQYAVVEGQLDPANDLFEPAFYFSSQVSEDFILQRINRAIARCPNMVHTAEDGQSIIRNIFHRVLYQLGAAPPFWRFLPAYLRTPPLPTLRKYFPSVGTKG
jgi:radical SAM superfamily enzyme YgiQ (UPF0313 family)